MNRARRIPFDVNLPCPQCGYNLRGLIHETGFRGKETGAICPECGHESDLWSMYHARDRRRNFRQEVVVQSVAIFSFLLPAAIAAIVRLFGASVLKTPVTFWMTVVLCFVHGVWAARKLAKYLDLEATRGKVAAMALGIAALNTVMILLLWILFG